MIVLCIQGKIDENVVSGDYLHSGFLQTKMSQMVIKKYKALSADNHIVVKY